MVACDLFYKLNAQPGASWHHSSFLPGEQLGNDDIAFSYKHGIFPFIWLKIHLKNRYPFKWTQCRHGGFQGAVVTIKRFWSFVHAQVLHTLLFKCPVNRLYNMFRQSLKEAPTTEGNTSQHSACAYVQSVYMHQDRWYGCEKSLSGVPSSTFLAS